MSVVLIYERGRGQNEKDVTTEKDVICSKSADKNFGPITQRPPGVGSDTPVTALLETVGEGVRKRTPAAPGEDATPTATRKPQPQLQPENWTPGYPSQRGPWEKGA